MVIPLPSKKWGLCIFVVLERHEICAGTACVACLIRVSPVLEGATAVRDQVRFVDVGQCFAACQGHGDFQFISE